MIMMDFQPKNLKKNLIWTQRIIISNHSVFTAAIKTEQNVVHINWYRYNRCHSMIKMALKIPLKTIIFLGRKNHNFLRTLLEIPLIKKKTTITCRDSKPATDLSADLTAKNPISFNGNTKNRLERVTSCNFMNQLWNIWARSGHWGRPDPRKSLPVSGMRNAGIAKIN